MRYGDALADSVLQERIVFITDEHERRARELGIEPRAIVALESLEEIALYARGRGTRSGRLLAERINDLLEAVASRKPDGQPPYSDSDGRAEPRSPRPGSGRSR